MLFYLQIAGNLKFFHLNTIVEMLSSYPTTSIVYETILSDKPAVIHQLDLNSDRYLYIVYAHTYFTIDHL